MQRLTKRLPDGNAVMDCDNCGLKKYKQCTLYGCRNRLMKRLADYEDNICYGYAGRSDCAMFRDFKAILQDCVDNKCDIIWM